MEPVRVESVPLTIVCLRQAITETWASHCDGFVAFSDVTDPDLNA